MAGQKSISEKSRRVAKNTLLLYFRMLLLMFIGLFTSRVVLKTLGVVDYGTYQVVNSTVMMFTVLSSSISGSISRFLAFELGSGDKERLRKVFSSAIIILIGFCLILFALAETVGVWYLKNRLVIPEGRETAAMWVLQTSTILLAIQLFSIPYNSTIVAHEDMKAFAWISILEGALKLSVAFALYITGGDRLIVYAVLMVVVAAIIRGTYAFFCKSHYEEASGKLELDISMIKPMLSMGAWSFSAYGVGVFNTQGVNLLSNAFFGVGINAVRGIAGQVENIVRQFVANFLTALNPLITKTWASGDREYCFELVRKGCKFCYLIVLLFAVPFLFESDFILHIWLGDVPDGAPLFTILVIFCVMTDFMSNSLAQLIVANGRVGLYYSVTSAISAITFLGSWFAFSKGAQAQIPYFIAMAVFIVMSILRLLFVKHQCGFKIRAFIKETVFPILLTSVVAVTITYLPHHFITTSGLVKSLVCIGTALLSVCISAYIFALTSGERQYFIDTIKRNIKK